MAKNNEKIYEKYCKKLWERGLSVNKAEKIVSIWKNLGGYFTFGKECRI